MKTNTGTLALHIGFFSKQAKVGTVKYQTKTRSLLHLDTIYLPVRHRDTSAHIPREESSDKRETRYSDTFQLSATPVRQLIYSVSFILAQNEKCD
jgi:hypothetical protein